jgi:hypothetical protein
MHRHKSIAATAAILIIFSISIIPGCSDDDCVTCPELPAGASLSSTVLSPDPMPSFYGGMYAAGSQDLFIAGAGGVVLRRQGTDWIQYDTGVIADLRDIWGTSASNVYAVGYNGTILHWNGLSWRTMDSGSFAHLEAIHGTSSTNVWAVAYDQTVLHYDGSSWTQVRVGIPQPNRSYYDVWCAPTGEVFIASGWYDAGRRGGVLRFDGVASWTEWGLFVDHVRSVWGTAADNFWCGDAAGNINFYDGSLWTGQHAMREGVNSIHGAAANDVWAVCAVYGGPVATGEMVHFDGTTWSPAGPTAVSPAYQEVVAVSASEVYARASESMFLGWDGSSWTTLNDTWITSLFFMTLWGSTANDMWLHDSGNTAWNTDGTSFTHHYRGTDEQMTAMWGTAADNIYAVGGNGTIVHYDGARWSEIRHGLGSPELYDIWGTSNNDIWVGTSSDGLMWHFDGSAWSEVSAWNGIYRNGKSLWGSAPDDWYAVLNNRGFNNGGVMHFDGARWSPVSLGGFYVKAVHGVSSSEIYFLTGEYDIFMNAPGQDKSSAQAPPGNTALIRYNPTDGTVTAEYLNARMDALWALGSDNVFFAGGRGLRMVAGHYDGSQVVMHDIDANSWVTDMWGTGSNTVFISSGPGALIRVTKN